MQTAERPGRRPSSQPRGTRVLERSLAMLSELAESDRPLSTAELARRADLPPSTAYRLVDELDGHGLVERGGDGGLALGLRLLALARRVEDDLAASLLDPARGTMRELAREHGETVLLTAPAGSSAIGLDAVEPARPVRLSFGRWRAAPMHLGASGKVLLAFLPSRAADRVLASVDGAVTASGAPVDSVTLRRELEAARRRGFVVTHGELDPGVSGIAAPVLGQRGRLLAGLTLVGPTERVGPRVERLSGSVRTAADAIGRAVQAR
jgi:DNA-binding IclR family transcriptional regulator